jgi:tRNA threonylcarbamoyladenosine biosynthesis protein TsaE
MSLRAVVRSPGETRRLAARLGKRVGPGAVIGLIGPLGAGKTCFVQGLAIGLEVPAGERVTSPTFNIVLEHRGRLPLFHVDLYRIAAAGELLEIGLEQYLHGEGVCAVEWLDRFPELAPKDFLEIRIQVDNPKQRTLLVEGTGPRSAELADAWLRVK